MGQHYEFQDYIWMIEKSHVNTCHRDNNGDFFNQHQKHSFLYYATFFRDMEKCLSVVLQAVTNTNYLIVLI